MKGPFGKVIEVPDDGWKGFNDVIWKNVYLEKDHYELQVYFVTGSVNLCSTAVYFSNESKPSPSPHHSPRPPTRHPAPGPSNRPSRYPTRHPTTRPTRSPHHHNQCYDDEDYHYDGDNWKVSLYQSNTVLGGSSNSFTSHT
jgi:hypothetical protein